MKGKRILGLAVSGLIVGGVLTFSVAASGAPPTVDAKTGVRAEAAGVNNGTKDQAPGIVMRPITPVDPAVVGKYGKAGGCTPGYGRGKACLPPIAPSAVAMGMTAQQHPWSCAEVRTILPKGIRLNSKGTDPLALDRNNDGLACGTGD